MISDVMSLEIRCTDGHERVGKREKNRWSDKAIEWDSIHRLAIVEEMFGSIHMRSCVRSKRDRRNVGSGAPSDCLLQLDVNFRIAGIDDAAGLYRN